MVEILSAFAELDAAGAFSALDASGCFMNSGIAGLGGLSGVAGVTFPGEILGCNVFLCSRAADDFTSLLVGRDGTTGAREIVLGRIELSPTSWDEDAPLLPGCMLLVGISDFGGCAESDLVLSSVTASASVSCFSDGVTAAEGALER